MDERRAGYARSSLGQAAGNSSRTAISWRLAAARISNRLATLAQAINSTNATTQEKISSDFRVFPTSSSFKGITRVVISLWRLRD